MSDMIATVSEHLKRADCTIADCDWGNAAVASREAPSEPEEDLPAAPQKAEARSNSGVASADQSTEGPATKDKPDDNAGQSACLTH